MSKKRKSKQTNSQRRKQNRLRLFVVLSALNIALLVGIFLMLPTAFRHTNTQTGETTELLGVTGIAVEGNTRYDDEAIIGVSGITEGKSVFSINKRSAAKKIRSAFTYAQAVDIDISFKRMVTIRITEAEELGAVYAGGNWMVVSRDGVGLMQLPVESERPFRRLYIKGAEAQADKIGEQILDEKTLDIVTELTTAMRQNGLAGVGEIDLTNRSDIRLNWKNQITIALGSDTNLTYEIAAAVSAIPKILSRHGDTATGLLNLSQYSDETVSTPVIVFTPSSILNAEKEVIPPESEEGATETGEETAGTTAAPEN